MIDISNDFYIDDGYIVKRQKNRKGEVSDKIICNRVEVVKKLFYPETKQTKVVIEISSMNGSNSMEFSCDVFTEQGVNVLLNYGLRFIKSDIPDLINYLIESERKAPLEYRYTSTGWHDTNNGIGFMLDKLYIDGVVQNDSRYAGDLKLEQKGKLKDWISVVKEEVIGKVPLEFVLLLGFSAPLLALLNDSNYDLGSVVFNLANFSSKGKTTAVMLATSVFSNPVSNKGTLVTYNATDNALMNILAKSDGLTIGIDEIGISKHNSKNFSSLLYAICSGSSKLRLNGDSSMKPSQTYSCFVISTAEYDIIDDDTMSADGNGYNTIIRKLNALGYKTKKGADFGKNSLYEILRNERYYGKFIFNKRSSAQFRRKRNNHAYKDESEMIVVEDGNPAIVSKSLWEKANQVRKAVNNKSVSANRVYLLTGLIRCGNCDSKLHGNVKRHKGKDKVYYSYRCSSRSSKLDCNCKEIRCEIIDTWVINEFIKYFFNEESIAYITKKLNESLVDTIKNSRDYTDAKSNMKTLLNNRKNLAEAIEKTDDSDYLLSKFKEVENRIKNAKEIIEQYENRIEIERVDEKTVRELIEQLRDYMYNPKNIAQTKYILSKYIEKVVVNNDEATVIFKVLAPVTTTGAIPYEPFECGYEETFTVNRKELFLIYKILETDEELNLIIRRLTTKNDKNTENSHRNIEKLQNQITENHIKTYPTQQNVG